MPSRRGQSYKYARLDCLSLRAIVAFGKTTLESRSDRRRFRNMVASPGKLAGTASLLLHFDLAYHPEVLVREMLGGRLSVSGKRHLAVQEVTPRRKVSPEPDDAAD